MRAISTTALGHSPAEAAGQVAPWGYWAVGVLPGPGARAKASKVHRFQNRGYNLGGYNHRELQPKLDPTTLPQTIALNSIGSGPIRTPFCANAMLSYS